jgi:hypothetical protein
MTKEEVITAIRECADEIGHVPSLKELCDLKKVSKRSIRKNFVTYALALQACGLERTGCGYWVSTETLFKEWASAARKLGKAPTMAEFEINSRFSARPLMSRFKTWNNVPHCLLEFGKKEGLWQEWPDVLKIIDGHSERKRRSGTPSDTPFGTAARSRILPNEPLFGTPLLHPAMINAPTNENGVMVLFGALACELGYAVTRVQTECPDCEALRKVDHERWQRVRIEFEYESRNFLVHLHSVNACDMIVCWKHNWPECPLEVLELREAVGRSGRRDIKSSEG